MTHQQQIPAFKHLMIWAFSAVLCLLISACNLMPSTPSNGDDSGEGEPGTAEPPTPTPSVSKVLIPLAEGNEWVYQINGNANDTITNSILKSLTVDDQTWYLLEEFRDTFWVRNSDEGYIQASNYLGLPEIGNDPKIEELLVLKTPQPDIAPYETVGGQTIHYQPCTEPLTVPAGTYSCHQFKFELTPTEYSIHYYAPDTGLIKSSFYRQGEVHHIELTEVNLH